MGPNRRTKKIQPPRAAARLVAAPAFRLGAAIPHLPADAAPTPSEREEIAEAIAKGAPPEMAARIVGVAPTLLANWLARGQSEEADPWEKQPDDRKQLTVEYHKQMTVPCLLLWKSVARAASDFNSRLIRKIAASPDWRAQAWLLERRDPGNFQSVKPWQEIPRSLNPLIRDAEIVSDNTTSAVKFYCPDNGRI